MMILVMKHQTSTCGKGYTCLAPLSCICAFFVDDLLGYIGLLLPDELTLAWSGIVMIIDPKTI